MKKIIYSIRKNYFTLVSKTILLFVITLFVISCSKDNEAPKIIPIQKEYPANMIYRWDGSVRADDAGSGAVQTSLIWNVKANGVLEVRNGAQPLIIGEWYIIANIFNCTYIAIDEKKYTYQLIKSKTLNMVGFRGLNGETSGSGRVYIQVI